ncbi:FAD binding domain-containing protein [Coprinopsis cinerea okayama7|uniref:FAD binding domain-containing protein n=1 Tax=Coprinopsis cinerea (strain Okayama-7 / 130 / ATCC MYA-4618 / FGSC 9003) TaxID=240176 RepID=D6RR40_COPC7|nr:FAD binding domain-containing protein [Coprinopsis cinerea okayama7\|eukprot:XP_002910018.1 FAD binding domain-containing protein [Coprinopsis cinerea okayama7\
MDRSTGYGSLAINAHLFKDVTFHANYTRPGWYSGPAVTVGAGIQGRELSRLGNQQNPPVAVVTGECPTVGFAGDYIQGGGHGPLASYYGMAADQAFSFEVITADGEYRTANVVENPDLFWALRGGGPSTFAAIVSATVNTFAEIPMAGVIMQLNTFNQDTFWKGFAAFHNLANHFVNNGSSSLHQPFYDQLRTLGVQYSTTMKPPVTLARRRLPIHQAGYRPAREPDRRRHSTRRWRYHRAHRWTRLRVDNAVHPAWRNGSSFSITNVMLPNTAGSLSQIPAAQQRLTNEIDGPIRAASPYGAAYVNEGNLEEPNWQEAYWGSNYPRLNALKEEWDPLGVLYARTTPVTELWEVIDFNRRLCKRRG